MSIKMKVMRIDQMIRNHKKFLSSAKQNLDRWVKRIDDDSYSRSYVLDNISYYHDEVKRCQGYIEKLQFERQLLLSQVVPTAYRQCEEISPIYDRDEIDDELDDLRYHEFIVEFTYKVNGIIIEE